MNSPFNIRRTATCIGAVLVLAIAAAFAMPAQAAHITGRASEVTRAALMHLHHRFCGHHHHHHGHKWCDGHRDYWCSGH